MNNDYLERRLTKRREYLDLLDFIQYSTGSVNVIMKKKVHNFTLKRKFKVSTSTVEEILNELIEREDQLIESEIERRK